MANEKSRNHERTGRNNDGSGKAQGKRDSDKPANSAKSTKSAKSGNTGSAGSAGRKPGPGKQARDQLNVRTGASAPGQQE